jgi:hypothetical protein
VTVFAVDRVYVPPEQGDFTHSSNHHPTIRTTAMITLKPFQDTYIGNILALFRAAKSQCDAVTAVAYDRQKVFASNGACLLKAPTGAELVKERLKSMAYISPPDTNVIHACIPLFRDGDVLTGW